MANFIGKEWHEFAAAALPPNVSDVQRREMQKAFYAGVWLMLQLSKKFAALDLPEEEVVKRFEAVEQECKEFTANLMGK